MSLCSLIGQHWMEWWFPQATGFVNWCKLLLVLRLVRVVSRCCLISCSELKPKSQQEEVQQDVSSKLAVGNKLGAETKQTSASKTKTVHTWRLTHEAGSDFSCEDGSRTERIKLSFDFTSSGVTRLFLLDPAVQRTNRHNVTTSLKQTFLIQLLSFSLHFNPRTDWDI